MSTAQLVGPAPSSAGSLSLAADGSFTFVALASASGNVTFDYSVTNFVGTGNTATITLRIAPQPPSSSCRHSTRCILSIVLPLVLGVPCLICLLLLLLLVARRRRKQRATKSHESVQAAAADVELSAASLHAVGAGAGTALVQPARTEQHTEV